MPSMSPQNLAAYKDMVENLSLMKRQQWRITAYVIAILAWVFGHSDNLALTNHPGLRCYLIGFLIAGCAVGCFFLFKIQCEIASERGRINIVKCKYFRTDKDTFGLTYTHTFRRGVIYPATFSFLIAISAMFVILSFYPP